jgi:uncharacterized membrane protein YeaQ/YmgE (transglycosylase-associated protein family)
VVCGGILAAYLDQQRDPTPITVGRGAFTGFLAGIIGAVVWMVVAAAVGAVLAPLQEQLADEMIRTAADAPPEVRRMIEWINANAGFAVAIGFLGRLVGGAIFATLGGVLGAAFFRNDVPPALGGPIQPPPLPPL